MPSKTPQQARLMRAAAHDAAFAASVGIQQGVPREFEDADKAKRTAALLRADGKGASHGQQPKP